MITTSGPPLGTGRPTVVLVHGRNAGPENILPLADRFDRPNTTYLAPAAANRTWYPLSFLAPIEQNQPALDSALAVLGSIVDQVMGAGVPPEQIVLAGFSQGACLSSEFAVRHPRRYGGVIVFSGGAIGPPGTVWPKNGTFGGTPVFLGCSDVDAHVPKFRVEETAALFESLGAAVTMKIYPGMGHLVNDDEIAFARRIIDDRC